MHKIFILDKYVKFLYIQTIRERIAGGTAMKGEHRI
jgi:hypothetical protein